MQLGFTISPKFQKILNASAQINVGYASVDDSVKFFSQLPKSFIKRLYDYYKVDFEMFGYDFPQTYIDLGNDDDDDDKQVESVDADNDHGRDSEDNAGANLVDEEQEDN